MEQIIQTKEGLPVVERKTIEQVYCTAIHSEDCDSRLIQTGGEEYTRDIFGEWCNRIETDQPSLYYLLEIYRKGARQALLDEGQENFLVSCVAGMYEVIRTQAEKDMIIDLNKLCEPMKDNSDERELFDSYK